MTVEELFRQLSFGELSNLSIGSEGAGSIATTHHNRLIHYANQSLYRLYSRFVLKEKDLALTPIEGRTLYPIKLRYAQSNPAPIAGDPVFILDAANPFQGDLIKILAVYAEGPVEFYLNDIDVEESLFTPQPDVLQIPRPKLGQVLAVVYQAKHPKLPEDDLTSEIELPEVLHGALLAHIAHQVFSNMNGQENAAKSADHLARYEMVCTEVLERDLVASSVTSSTSKLHDRGFI